MAALRSMAAGRVYPEFTVLEYQARRLQVRLSRVCVLHSGGFVSRRSIALGGG